MSKLEQNLKAMPKQQQRVARREMGYNGWANYATWLVSVWGYVDSFYDMASEDGMNAVTAEWCEDMFNEYVDADIPRDGIISDMVRSQINSIDWRDIADHINSDLSA